MENETVTVTVVTSEEYFMSRPNDADDYMRARCVFFRDFDQLGLSYELEEELKGIIKNSDQVNRDVVKAIQAVYGECIFKAVNVYEHGAVAVRFSKFDVLDSRIDGIAFIPVKDIADFGIPNTDKHFKDYEDMVNMYLNNEGQYLLRQYEIDKSVFEAARNKNNGHICDIIETLGEENDSLTIDYVPSDRLKDDISVYYNGDFIVYDSNVFGREEVQAA